MVIDRTAAIGSRNQLLPHLTIDQDLLLREFARAFHTLSSKLQERVIKEAVEEIVVDLKNESLTISWDYDTLDTWMNNRAQAGLHEF